MHLVIAGLVAVIIGLVIAVVVIANNNSGSTTAVSTNLRLRTPPTTTGSTTPDEHRLDHDLDQDHPPTTDRLDDLDEYHFADHHLGRRRQRQRRSLADQ